MPETLTMTVDTMRITLGISRSHAYAMVAEGRIPSIRLGNKIVIPKRAVDELLATR